MSRPAPPPALPTGADASVVSRPVVLCADDYALSEGVSEAILHLARADRLSAISCMTAGPRWPELARRLDRIEGRCDIGLHLTLTDQAPIGRLPRLAPEGRLPRLGRLFAQAFTGRLDAGEVADELARQWDAFTAARGRTPDFVDGHQHVHLLPVVRDGVLDLMRRGANGRRPYLRVCHEPPARVLARGVAAGKSLFLGALSQPLRRAAAAMAIPSNDSFRGVHAFDPRVDYATLFPRFLAGAASRPLIMCHPGFVDATLRSLDPVTDARRREYDYFASERFPADLRAAGCHLVRFAEFAATASRHPG